MSLFQFRSPVSIATVASIVILFLALFVLHRNIQKEAQAWQWVVHTQEVLETLQTTLTFAQEIETSQRGFLLTGNQEYLLTYRQTINLLFGELKELEEITRDNPSQQNALQDYRRLANERIQKMEEVLELNSRNGEFDPSLLEPGRSVKEELLKQANTIRAEEEKLLEERREIVGRARAELIGAVAAVLAVAILLIILLWFISERDAVQIRRAQRELSQANQYLEQRVEERTQQIAEANEELRAFAHTVAHDLRAPLRNVEGFATALLEDESERLSEDGKLFAKRITGAVVRMDKLITDLLAYSRLSRSELRLEHVPYGRAVQTVLRDLEAEILQSQAVIDIDGPLPAARANEGVLVQIIANLVSNAVKFVNRGKVPHIRIRGSNERGCACLVIEDNGIGIEPEHQERIFGVFERLHGQEQYPGTGIGLAIVKKGIERMGGQVRVFSQPAQGTRFEISLPAA